ncbi:MAG: hypothetical protein WC494_00655 [Candidatus Pacearchaeota archaeon]
MKYNVRVVSSFPPRLCGIGTYAENKLKGTQRYTSEIGSINVAAIDGHHSYDSLVDLVIRQEDKNSWITAAKDIGQRALEKNSRGRIPTVVDINHEFGLGGRNWATENNYGPFLDTLRETPAFKKGLLYIVTTLHTILSNPTPHLKEVTRGLVEKSDATIVLSSLGKRILSSDVYSLDIDENLIEHIEHGVRMDSYTTEECAEIKESWSIDKDVFTFVLPGLISSGKGIFDYTVPAYRKMVDELTQQGSKARTRLIIRGKSHPDFERNPSFEEFVEQSRGALLNSRLLLNPEDPFNEISFLRNIGRKTRENSHGIMFAYRPLSEEEYSGTFAGGDVPVFAYKGVEQISSGQIVEAIGHGRAPISSKFWHACEVLSPGNSGSIEDILNLKMPSEGEIIGMKDPNARGLLVDCDKGSQTIEQLANCMVKYVQDPETLQLHRDNAREKGKTMTWDEIFGQNLKLFKRIRNRKLNEQQALHK